MRKVNSLGLTLMILQRDSYYDAGVILTSRDIQRKAGSTLVECQAFGNTKTGLILINQSKAQTEVLAHEFGHLIGHPGLGGGYESYVMYEKPNPGGSDLDLLYLELLKRYLDK